MCIFRDLINSQTVKVDIRVDMTAHANVEHYYQLRRNAILKHEKTIQAMGKALKSAERKIRMELKQVKITASIQKVRKPFWFEKFLWFISSENYLVIAGRDMQQNELLVKRHLTKGDLYVHADLHGASSVIIKNHSGDVIPPATLSQAGCMSICQSRGWDAKIVTSASYVYHDQVRCLKFCSNWLANFETIRCRNQPQAVNTFRPEVLCKFEGLIEIF